MGGGGAGDLVQDTAAVGPVAQVAPRFGVALGQRLVVRLGAGPGRGQQRVAFGPPVRVGRLQADSGLIKAGERAAPVRLPLGCGKRGELLFGEGEEFFQVRAEVFEGPPGVGVALSLAAAVRKVVQGPALVIGVPVGVVVPLLEDVSGGAGVDGELVQDELVDAGVDLFWAFLRSGAGAIQRRAGAADEAVGGVAGMRVASDAAVLRCSRAAARTRSSRWRCSAASCSPWTVVGSWVSSHECGSP